MNGGRRDDRKRREGRSMAFGFTLVEVLAAFVLLIIVLPAVAKGISICTKATGAARRQVEAATLADGKLGELLAYPSLASGTLSGDFSPEYPEYSWMAASTVRDVYLQEVMVVVTWVDATGEQSFTLSSIIYGLQSSDTSDTSSSTSGGSQ
jgi:Tfp pilus assembly protein PilV